MSLSTLAAHEKETLLELSRRTLVHYLQTGKILPFKTNSPALNQKAAVFVTLYLNERLRGCVGQIKAQHPLFFSVQSASVSAGFSDPRFPNLNGDELKYLRIKIAILSALYPISPNEIEIGKHGLLLEAAGRRGLLLPEVASEREWDTATFLENLCLKAQLPAGSWEKGNLSGFTTMVFQDP